MKNKWIKRDTEWYIESVMAGSILCENAITIDKGYRYNGSGKNSFGGVDNWPAVKLDFSLPNGREDLQDELIEILKKTVVDFIEDKKILEIKDA